MCNKRTHIPYAIESPISALCRNRYARKFEDNSLRKVTCKTCRRLVQKRK